VPVPRPRRGTVLGKEAIVGLPMIVVDEPPERSLACQ